MQPEGHHIAEFNIGTLAHDWDDPRVADFVNGLALVNGIAARSKGFVWRMGDDEMDAAQNDSDGALGGNPRTASTLSVWETPEALQHFVWHTLHKRFYDRGGEWYDPADNTGTRLVMWWVPAGHRPSIGEAAARLAHLSAHGESDHAFSWSYLNAAREPDEQLRGDVA